MSDDARRQVRDDVAKQIASTDQLFALMRTDDEFADSCIELAHHLNGWITDAARHGLDRVQVFGIATGILLAALDHLLPPT